MYSGGMLHQKLSFAILPLPQVPNYNGYKTLYPSASSPTAPAASRPRSSQQGHPRSLLEWARSGDVCACMHLSVDLGSFAVRVSVRFIFFFLKTESWR